MKAFRRHWVVVFVKMVAGAGLVVTAGCALLVAMVEAGQWFSSQAVRRDKAEICAIFDRAIADGTASAIAAGKYTVGADCGGASYYVRYRDAAGETQGYFVSRIGRDRWEFQRLTDGPARQVFVRERVSAE
ncbi:hypothetical protein TSACC_2872 [Terrimicrobium sacchariphilum]|jgi:hypothetical protein|uniref:Uncharacterized protein n=1 Tax=Terrimicrobium sacchariphilum TaxID=690879 RepID=A0A146G4X0_TERSA|nr:hypothetical protein [Terrimicrobium sacchariphilum]GAT32473.1 hypothetical protein TSACC_2872 [Terrimicrobium sacchariphilum]